MDELDKQLAELQLITQSELKQNPNATDASQVKKKIGPAVPPKPKKIYSNLPQIGVPKPFEKPENTHNSTALTYSNQDGLIYSNILHEPSKTAAPLNHTFISDNSLYSNVQIKNMTVVEDLPPPPPLELSPDYVQCNVPPPFPPPPIPSEDNEDDLPPPPPVISSGSTQDFSTYDPNVSHISNNSVYTPMGGSAYLPKSVSPNLSYTQNSVSPNRLLQHSVSPTRYNSPSSVTSDNRENAQYPPKSVSPQYYQGGYQPQERYPETQFSTAEPQVPNSKSTGRLNYISPNYENQSIYANQPKNLYSNEGVSRDNTPNLVSPKNNLYSNVPMHQYNQQNVHLQHFTNNCPTYENTVLQQKNMNEIQENSSGNSVLNYPGSSVSDYANQVQMFRPGSSASNYIPNVGFDSSVSLQQRSDFRSGSSASNYLPQDFENQTESIYAPLRRPEDNDLPPPPPIMNNKTRPNLPPIITCGINDDSVGGEDIPAPASPVSSSYSELRRATDLGGSHGFNPYAPGSHTSSTYESIYEPINPRPPSQASVRSGYSLYGGHTGTLNSQKQSNELEVDQLTNLLVQSMDPSSQEEYFEICVKCNQSIIGEENGCTAMDKFYHVDCFTCFECNINLQGKPFYSLEGKPYCKQDYLNTLEKCCVCMEPILDRILRATGKPYHPKCFTCVVCGKSLDGIPFTVDATNQIHCIEDFHKKFAPRCCVCKLPIMPENGQEETVRVVALDRSFHVGCYKCEDCGLVLSSEAEGRGCYPLDDHVLCKNCNAKRVQALTLHMTTDL